LTVNKY